MFLHGMKAGALGVAVLLGMASPAWAQTAEDYFQQGVKAADKGAYQQALDLFNKARKAGMDKASLDYNLAVAYYRLGKYEQSRKLFTKLTDNGAFAQLAAFNLGLIANKQKDEAAAVRWFQKAYTRGDDPKIQALAATALERLGQKLPQRAPTKPTWTGMGYAALISDSNVNLATDEVLTPSKSDTALELYVAANQWLRGDRQDGLRLNLGLTSQTYSSETQYNFLQLNAGLSRYGQLFGWQTRFTGDWAEINVDGSSYERVFSAMADGHKDLGQDRELQLRYRLSRIIATDSGTATIEGNDYLDGMRHQIRAGVQQGKGNRRVRAYYQLELNDRDDYVGPVSGRFISYSPTRHTLQLTGYMPVSAEWNARFDGRYRLSTYNDPEDLVAGGSKTREDTQWRLSAQVSREIGKQQELEVRYSYTDNDSNLNVYDYDRSVLQAGILWFF